MNRIYMPRMSEVGGGESASLLFVFLQVKQMHKFSYKSRMCTEGGRKILMNRILMDHDVLAH